MLREHINFKRKGWEEIMWINNHEYRLFRCKFHYLNPYFDVFRNMYFKNRVAVPPKCFICRV